MPPEARTPQPTEVTVKLTPKSVDALLHAARLGGLSRTDTINRAIQVYDYILDIIEQNPTNQLLVSRNGKMERIYLT